MVCGIRFHRAITHSKVLQNGAGIPPAPFCILNLPNDWSRLISYLCEIIPKIVFSTLPLYSNND